MKQKTRELIESYQRAFNQGKQVMYFGKTKDNGYYTWLPIKDVKEIKKLVLNNIEMRIW